MANGHNRNLLSPEGTIIAAICDVNESAVKSKGEELGLPEHKRYRKYENLKKMHRSGKAGPVGKAVYPHDGRGGGAFCIIPRTPRTVHDRVY